MRTLTCLMLGLVSAMAAVGNPELEQKQPPKSWGPAPPPPGPPCEKVMACPRIWLPVCGCTCDGMYCRTFPSMCELHSHNCHNTPDYNFNRNGTCDQCPPLPYPPHPKE